MRRLPLSASIVSVGLVLALSACDRAALELPKPRPTAIATASVDADAARRIEADLRFLADDLLEGREAGTRGFDLAALYVAERFRAIGLAPAGDDGTYFQQVPLLKATREAEGARFAPNSSSASSSCRT